MAWNGTPSSYSGAGMRSRISSHSGLRSLPSTSGSSDAQPTRAIRVDDRELDLVLVGAEVDEQFVDLVDDLGDPGVGPVDLVDNEDHRKVRLESLAEHETGLRERAFARVDEEEHTVDHGERALDLTAEVGVAGSVDDVEGHVAVLHRGVLREDRDALLALEVVRVHHPLVDVLVGAERSGLPEKRVDEGGLAVVDVGDDRHVAQVVARAHEDSKFGGTSQCRGGWGWIPSPRSTPIPGATPATRPGAG